MSNKDEVTVARTKSGYVVSVAGNGTRLQSPSVRDFACGAIEDGEEVVVDLSACQYLDSTFLGCLVILHKRGCENCDRFRVYAEETVRSRLLHPTRLDEVFTFCPQPPQQLGLPVILQRTELERKEFGRHLLATHEELAQVDSPAAGAFAKVAAQLRKELNDA
jgi:anti-anti-sigma regulatory factor